MYINKGNIFVCVSVSQFVFWRCSEKVITLRIMQIWLEITGPNAPNVAYFRFIIFLFKRKFCVLPDFPSLLEILTLP